MLRRRSSISSAARCSAGRGDSGTPTPAAARRLLPRVGLSDRIAPSMSYEIVPPGDASVLTGNLARSNAATHEYLGPRADGPAVRRICAGLDAKARDRAPTACAPPTVPGWRPALRDRGRQAGLSQMRAIVQASGSPSSRCATAPAAATRRAAVATLAARPSHAATPSTASDTRTRSLLNSAHVRGSPARPELRPG